MMKKEYNIQIRKITVDNLPFLLIAAVAVFWHVTIRISVGDDLVYFSGLLDTGNSIGEILAHRYETWSSRMVIEFVLLLVVNHPILWKILDCIIFTSIPVMLCKIIEADWQMKWWCAGLVLLYPFSDMVSAGWIATTTNYLWPLWCLIFIGTLLKKILCSRKITWYEAGFGIAACIYGSSQEQVAVILLVLLALCAARLWRSKNYKQPLLYLFGLIDVVMLITILCCPGNSIRSGQEAAGRMPQFPGFTFADKLYMGLLNVEQVFIADADSIFLVFAAVLLVLVFLKTADCRKTAVSGLPLLVVLGHRITRDSHVLYEKIFIISGDAAGWNRADLQMYFPLIFLAVTLAGVIYALYQLQKEDRERWLYTILFLACGLASGVVMGFSPTIYASGRRPYIYLYFMLILVCLSCIKKEKERILAGLSKEVLKLVNMGLLLLCISNIGGVWWICYIMGKQ